MRMKSIAGMCVAGVALFVVYSNVHATGTASASRSGATDEAAILVGAGDIADCKNLSGAEATAKLLEQIPGTVMAVGDLAYPDGSKENFACYDKTWGRVRTRTRPAAGNHEFHAGGATPYFDYFGASAGDPKNGYYSYELGSWHIVVLNSECRDIGGCDRLRDRFNGCAPIWPRTRPRARWRIGTSRSSARAVHMGTIRR
jgi:hypothetical protein